MPCRLLGLLFFFFFGPSTYFFGPSTYFFFLSYSSFIDFQVWDFPGQMDFFDPTFDTTAIFGEVGALVFVIDSQVY